MSQKTEKRRGSTAIKVLADADKTGNTKPERKQHESARNKNEASTKDTMQETSYSIAHQNDVISKTIDKRENNGNHGETKRNHAEINGNHAEAN